MQEQKNLIETDLLVDAAGRFHLKESATWAKFLAVTGFLYSLLVVALALRKAMFMFRMKELKPQDAEFTVGGVSVVAICLVAAGFIFLVSLYLFRFSKSLHNSLMSNDTIAFSEALKNQRAFFRYTGILASILLLFTILAVIGLIIGPQD
ncbi:MAG: hypothetical protein V4725_07110 [Bacteroidota bacterium]